MKPGLQFHKTAPAPRSPIADLRKVQKKTLVNNLRSTSAHQKTLSKSKVKTSQSKNIKNKSSSSAEKREKSRQKKSKSKSTKKNPSIIEDKGLFKNIYTGKCQQ